MEEISRTKRYSLILFLVLSWGASWPIYKISLAYTPPLIFAAMRTLFGGLLLAIIIIPKWKLIRWRENWLVYFISSIFNVVIFFGLQTVGLMYLPEGLFSVIVYLQPVLVSVFAWLCIGESMSLLKIIGLVMGFLGVACVSAQGFSGKISIIGIILALVTAFSWAIGTIYVKKINNRVDSMWLVAFQSFLGGILLTGFSSVSEKWSSIIWTVPYFLGLLFGFVIGIAATWVVYFKLVNSGDASKVASYTFLVPLIAVFSGTLFLGEPFTMSLVIGLLLIIVSIYIVNRKPSIQQTKSQEQPNGLATKQIK
jgi:drug/metabolite transporter (DMT)-like permease